MKQISIAFIIFLISISGTYAQNNSVENDDSARIILSTYLPDSDNLPTSVKNIFENKLIAIAAANGMGGNIPNSQFIITGKIDIISKDITPTAPPMHAYNLDVTLFVGDGINGTKYSSYTSSLKGVGSNETKAYIAALKNLNPRNQKYEDFINKAKISIVQHYNTNCDFLIKKAENFANLNNFDVAIQLLSSVPEVSQECYNKSLEAVIPIYKKKINRDCQIKLNEANSIWSAGQDLNAANKAGKILAEIDPQAECYTNAQRLSNTIGKKVKELNDREWEFILKKEQAMIDDRKNTLEAIRAIGEAYGRGQAQNVSYNTRGWW